MTAVRITVESPAGDVQVDVDGPDITALTQQQPVDLADLLDDAVARVRRAYNLDNPATEEPADD